MKKKLLSLVLALTLCLAAAVPARAYDMGSVDKYNVISCTDYTAAIDMNGSLWTWGVNVSGQLGFEGGNAEGSTLGHVCQTTPVKVLDNVVSVSCGGGGGSGTAHTAAIKTDGSLWMWGDNSAGQLGNGTEISCNTPVKVLDNVTAVSCGFEHTAAIKTDGSLWMWGGNGLGELGNSTEVSRSTPAKVLDNVIAVSCGWNHTAAIKSDGSLWTWGNNKCGQLGNGTMTDWYTSVAPVKVLDNVAAVSCGSKHTAAIKTDGSLWTWGESERGKLGFEGGNEIEDTDWGWRYYYQSLPVKVLDNVAEVSCGDWHTAAIKTDGSLWTWGTGSHGQLGDGAENSRSTPTRVLDNVVAVSCGRCHTAVVKSDGSLWTCGYNREGQLGYEGGNSSSSVFADAKQNVPKQVAGLTVKLSASARSESSSFFDVKASDYFAKSVAWAVERGITNGTSQTTFSPEKICTQGQILTFLWRAKGEPAPAGTVSGSEYYAKAAQWAKEQGLTEDFSAEADCTRAMVVTYLWKLAGSPQTGASGFTDVPADAPYAQAVAWAVAQGITNGTGDSTFSPDATCTRGQIVTFLYRALAE